MFFRSGVLNQLEAKRDELLSDRIVQMQANCRGYLARRKMARRRVQVIIRCPLGKPSQATLIDDYALLYVLFVRKSRCDAFNEM